MDALQLWKATSAATATGTAVTGCDAIILPANGVLSFASGAILTLAADTVFKPACSSVVAEPAIIANGGVNIDQTTSSSDPQFSDFRDPFYASTFPQCYALAATTIISYMLVIMLLIAPRSFLDGGVVVLGRRGFTNGHSNGISIGGRPWLQKVAALTVAISLTIATADTFRVAEDQYAWGIQNAEALQDEVLGGTQLKVIRLISDTFLWLAQAQTLIRLFPRQREKVIIKWTAFSLITLDVIFGALNSFQYSGPGNTRPRSFTDAVPALSYLFQLSLGLLYAAWVLYYSLMKKRYAFYHPLMKNICLVACLSVISILVPVVFFILDISKPEFTGWGDYVRWVGAAAASVVVWEWVERIEALEREEKKDGILGREVFDGDEMMEASSTDFSWPRRRKTKKKGEDEDGGESGGRPSDRGPPSRGRSKIWPAMSSITSRYMSRSVSHSNSHQKSTIPATTAGRSPSRFLQPPLWPSRPPPAVTPISRADTASADSTVYAVRYAPLTETASRTTDDRAEQPLSRSNSSASSEPDGRPSNSSLARAPSPDRSPTTEPEADHRAWRAVYKFASFRSSAHAPPAEVLPHAQKLQPSHRDFEGGRWDIRSRFEDFAAIQAERMREKMRPTPDTESLPVTVIPAPPRRGAALAQLLEEELHTAPNTGLPGGVSASPVPSELTRSGSNASAPGPPSPLAIGSDNLAADARRPTLSPLERHDAVQLRTVRRDNVPTPTYQRSASTMETMSRSMAGERRPVDDILGDVTPSN